MRFLISFLTFFLLSACAANNNDQQNSSFFKESFPLLESAENKNEYSYIAPRVNFKKYKQIYVAPVAVYDDKDGLQMTKPMKDQIQENYRLQLMLILRDKGYDVVYDPAPEGVELHTAVTSVRYENGDFELSDFLLWPDFDGEEEESGYDTSTSLGERHIEVRGEAFLWDTRAKTTVGQFVSIQKGSSGADDNNEITYNEVRPVIDNWADRVADWTCHQFKK